MADKCPVCGEAQASDGSYPGKADPAELERHVSQARSLVEALDKPGMEAFMTELEKKPGMFILQWWSNLVPHFLVNVKKIPFQPTECTQFLHEHASGLVLAVMGAVPFPGFHVPRAYSLLRSAEDREEVQRCVPLMIACKNYHHPRKVWDGK